MQARHNDKFTIPSGGRANKCRETMNLWGLQWTDNWRMLLTSLGLGKHLRIFGSLQLLLQISILFGCVVNPRIKCIAISIITYANERPRVGEEITQMTKWRNDKLANWSQVQPNCRDNKEAQILGISLGISTLQAHTIKNKVNEMTLLIFRSQILLTAESGTLTRTDR